MRTSLLVLAACTAPLQEDVPAAIAGVQVRFALDGPLDTPDAFYAHPFPSDLRTDAAGRLRWEGFPRPADHVPTTQLLSVARDGIGAPVIPSIYLRFDADVAPSHPDDGPRGLAIDDGLLLIDVDPDSPSRGRLFPALAQTLPVDDYVPQGLLGVVPYPGFVLPPGRRMAAVVLRRFGDAEGAPLGVPEALARLARGETPAGALGPAAAVAFAPLWPTLTTLGVDPADVAAATVFTTADVVAETRTWTDALRADHPVEITALAVDPDGGADHSRFCALRGTLRLPQLQVGAPPFDTEGSFVIADGLPVVQREEDVPVVLTIPRTVMPAAGFPVVFYAHGTDGLSSQVVDRGPTLEAGGEPQPGLGPAHVLARHGLAAVGMGVLLGAERVPTPRNRAYLNLQNLAAYRDTWRQGQLEGRLLLDALERLRIDADVLEGCAGVDLGGAPEARLDLSRLGLMGQSAGAHLATELAALDDRVHGVVPTGSGGYWPLLLAGGSRVGGPPELFGLILGTSNPLTILHPGLGLLEAAWSWAEPLAFAPRIADDPLPTAPLRHLYVPFGQDDGYFPEPIYDAMAVAYGGQRAGPALWPGMDASLALAGLEGTLSWPVTANRSGGTRVVSQWSGDGLVDSHNVFAQAEGLKLQYGCFFATLHTSDAPTVVEPGAETDPCE